VWWPLAAWFRNHDGPRRRKPAGTVVELPRQLIAVAVNAVNRTFTGAVALPDR
jgi:hypothetical protein